MSEIFKAKEIQLNQAFLIQQATDPSGGAGTPASTGSLVLQSGTTGRLWLKTGIPDTAWQELTQSFDWFVVTDFGAVGNGIADDTMPIQAAMNACASAGGGVVFFPPGTYAIQNISLTGSGQSSVQLLGSGPTSTIRWVFNALGSPGSMITISAGVANVRISLLRLDGGGLTNPSAGRDNHLISVSGAGGGVTTTHVMQCQIGDMAPGSGDGVHVVGTAGNLVSRLWIVDNYFDGCSRFSIGVEQGLSYCFIVDNFLTNCETEVAFVSTGSTPTNAVTLSGNQLIHTSASIPQALRLEGDPVGLLSRVTVGQNAVIGGFVTVSNVQWASFVGNTTTSGIYASAEGVWRFFNAVTEAVFSGANVITRSAGAAAGPCVSVEKATTAPSMLRIGQNAFRNEASGDFVKIVDAVQISVGANVCHSLNAGASAVFGIDVQAVTVAMTDILIGPGNQLTTEAGSLAACVRLLANGANMSDASIVGNQGDSCSFGVQFQIGGGGGLFNGSVMYNGNNFNSTTGDINDVGVTVRPHIGFNASTLGANLFTGTGAPETVVSASVASLYLRSDGGLGTTLYYKESGSAATGWIGVGGAPIVFGANDLGTAATALFFAPGFTATATVAELKLTITRPGTLRNFYVEVAAAGTTAQTVTYTVRKNGANTALTCSLSNTAAGTASDTNTAHAVSVIAGDLISVSIVKGGAVASGQTGVVATIEFD